MKNYFKFIIVGLLTALFFETIANKFFDGQLFKQPNAVPFFILWYGFTYTCLYFVFHRINFLVDPIIYGIMALVPVVFVLRKK